MLKDAMKEVVEKVLSGPIRPHFAILCVSPTIDLDEAQRLITLELGSTTPIIICDAGGIIGRDAPSGEVREVMFPYYEEEDREPDPADYSGISLTVGYVPGLKVDVIPLLYQVEGCSSDKFVMDIKNYSASVSGYTSPEAIFIFGDSQADMKPVVEKLDCALSQRTVVAGNESCRFRWASTVNNSSSRSEQRQTYGAVGLVFASDEHTPNGAWKIDFHFAVGSGVIAVGPTFRVVSAKLRSGDYTTWLTAKREGENETLDGEQILEALDFDQEVGDSISDYDLYIGVTKRRKYSIGSNKFKAVTSLSYHPVQHGDEQYLYVRGLDIKTGDSFRFYVADSRSAHRHCDAISRNIRSIMQQPNEVIGGFLFSCCGRGPLFFDQPNVDSSPILDNYPSIPLSGMFCGSEIGRGPPLVAQAGEEKDIGSARTSLHVYSSIYVLMSCSKPLSRP